MQDKNPASLKGHFLTAMPGLADPNFSYTVTCVCEHTPEGTLGIVINRPHPSLTAKLIFDELKLPYVGASQNAPIYVGGPVHMDQIFILHGPPFEWDGCLNVTTDLAMSNTLDILKAIALGNGPQLFMIALGCAGWGAGQLESEIKNNSWLTTPANHDIIFNIAVDQRWAAAVKQMGIDPALLSIHAGHA